MKRNVDLKEISDGRLYSANDMVKADCGGCQGCSACCRGMGSSIVLDPLDAWRLGTWLHLSFDQMLERQIELNLADGVILPNLKMAGPEERCPFLNDAGRCAVHPARPGVCRLFPLGRYYENHGFRYFLQIHECPSKSRSKIRVSKWVDTPRLKDYEAFVTEWHYFLNYLEERVRSCQDAGKVRELNLYMLKQFYLLPWDGERDFYEVFRERLEAAREAVG